MRPRARRRLARALAGAGAGARAALGSPRPAGATEPRGTYRLAGTARIDARPFPAREEDLHADAVVAPGTRPGQVRLHLATEGGSCDLVAARGPGGALSLVAGQRCAVDLRGGEAEGRVDLRLTSGRGRLGGEALSLELDFALEGTVRLAPGGSLATVAGALGLAADGPIAVQGQAHARAEGRRDRSRAAASSD